jgi:hypothetical protein
VYFFYKTVLGFKFIKQKVDFLKAKELALEYKGLAKNLETRLALLDKDSKEQARLELGLRELMIRFIRFETLSQNIKMRKRREGRAKKMIQYWRGWNKKQIHTENQLEIFMRLLDRKNMKIFL